LIVLFCDGYIQAKKIPKIPQRYQDLPEKREKIEKLERIEKFYRFFNTASRLPIEMQMTLANRAFASTRDCIKAKDSAKGFLYIFKLFGG
jgi:hypothetical protein